MERNPEAKNPEERDPEADNLERPDGATDEQTSKEPVDGPGGDEEGQGATSQGAPG